MLTTESLKSRAGNTCREENKARIRCHCFKIIIPGQGLNFSFRYKSTQNPNKAVIKVLSRSSEGETENLIALLTWKKMAANKPTNTHRNK